MKHTFLYITLILFVLIHLSGCSSQTERHSAQLSGKNKGLETRLPKKDSNSPHYYYMLSRLNNKKSELPEAIFFLKKALDKDPESIFLKKELLNLYLALLFSHHLWPLFAIFPLPTKTKKSRKSWRRPKNPVFRPLKAVFEILASLPNCQNFWVYLFLPYDYHTKKTLKNNNFFLALCIFLHYNNYVN